jgi:iron complex transport system substrate-binding protein
MRLCAASILAMLVLASSASAGALDDASRYLIGQRAPSGGFAEPGGSASPGLTGWAILGLVAADHCPTRSGDYLRGKPYPTATDLELRILALDALRARCTFEVNLSGQVTQLIGLRKPSGRIGANVNSTIWGVLALRAVGRRAGSSTISYLRAQQKPGGGWPWYPGGRADSNDTAAAIQALRAAGVSKDALSIRRGLAYLRRHQNDNGGFELTAGRGSDTQSTAWAIQAFISANRLPGRAAFSYLRSMQRANGSFRYSRQYVTTPVWVTSQALAALAREPFPLR